MEREDVGKRIKQLRMEQKLTLRELGEKANLSVSYISLAERGLTTISLTSLQNIAAALGVSSTDFFQVPEDMRSRITRSYDRKVLRLANSFNIYHSLLGDIPDEECLMEPMFVTLLPGFSRDKVIPYSHEGEEFGFVIEGTLTFLIEDKVYSLNPGDSLHLSSQIPHNWANFTNKLVKLIYVTTGKVFTNI